MTGAKIELLIEWGVACYENLVFIIDEEAKCAKASVTGLTFISKACCLTWWCTFYLLPSSNQTRLEKLLYNKCSSLFVLFTWMTNENIFYNIGTRSFRESNPFKIKLIKCLNLKRRPPISLVWNYTTFLRTVTLRIFMGATTLHTVTLGIMTLLHQRLCGQFINIFVSQTFNAH